MKILIQTGLIMASAVSFGFGFNETFATPNVIANFTASGDGSVFVTVEPTGGNPNHCLIFDQTTSSGSTFRYFVVEDTYYDPTIEGQIDSIFFSVDFLAHYDLLQGPPNSTINMNLYLVQGDGIFMNVHQVSQSAVVIVDGWQTVSGTYNTSDFTPDSGAFDPNAPTRFAFGFSDSLPFQAETQWRVDNFVVDVDAVPEPATMTVLAGLALLAKRRKVQK